MPRQITPLQRAVLEATVEHTTALTKVTAQPRGISNLGIRFALPPHVVSGSNTQQAGSVNSALNSLLMRGLVTRVSGDSGDEWLAKLPEADEALQAAGVKS